MKSLMNKIKEIKLSSRRTRQHRCGTATNTKCRFCLGCLLSLSALRNIGFSRQEACFEPQCMTLASFTIRLVRMRLSLGTTNPAVVLVTFLLVGYQLRNPVRHASISQVVYVISNLQDPLLIIRYKLDNELICILYFVNV